MIVPSGRPVSGGQVRVFAPHQLPRGFLLHLDDPPQPPVNPRPSSTLVLIKRGATALEVLLLRRSPRSGFIPGAWVFPGGTVDHADGDPALLPYIHGLTSYGAQKLLGHTGSEQTALAFWVAAMREAFEETGILLFRGEKGAGDSLLHGNPEGREEIMARARSRLLAGEMTFHQVLVELKTTLDASALAYFGHWLTPECEPRRYETRFFLAKAPSDLRVTPHKRELVEALWITPGDALVRNREGTLPLVLPTLFTLEQLEPFRSPREAIRQLKAGPVPRRLPVPQRTQGGIRFHLEG